MATAEINGFRMHYEESGSGDPVILHHGFISRSDIWTPVIDRLGADRRYIRLDCRGAGASGAPADGYTMRTFALDTIALADHLGLDRFSFIGHSMGGGTGFQLGLNHADRLDKLILLAPAPADAGAFLAALERGEVEPSLMVALGALIPVALGRDRDQIAEIARYLYLREPDPAVYNRFVEGVAEAGAGHIGFFDDLATNAALDGDLARLDTPTAMLVGDQDSLAPTNLADFQRLPNATLHVFSGTGQTARHGLAPGSGVLNQNRCRHDAPAGAHIGTRSCTRAAGFGSADHHLAALRRSRGGARLDPAHAAAAS